MDDLMKASDPPPIQRYRLQLGPEVYRLGAPPRSDAEEFARIGNGVLMNDGSAVVSDAMKLRLVHIAPDGDSIRLVGRSGSGPGEFRELLSLFHSADDDSTIYVLDNGLHRLVRFRLKSRALEHTEASTYPFDTYEACGWYDGYVALRYDVLSERILHLQTYSGKVTHSFGRPILRASHRMNTDATQGYLICAPELNLVFLVTSTGEIIAIHPSDAVAWRVRIHAFMPDEVTDIGGGVIRITTAPPPENRSTRLGSFIRLDDSLAVLQLLVYERWDSAGKSRIRFSNVQTRLIDLRTGQQLGRQDDLPRLLAIRRSKALLTGDEPEPWVALSRLSLVQGGR